MLFGLSLKELAENFPAEAPVTVQRAFDETLDALGLERHNYRLVYVSLKAVRRAVMQSGGQSISIGQCGECIGKTAFVVRSDNGGRSAERATAIHEALHFVFGDHPWPHEITAITNDTWKEKSSDE